MFIYPNMGDGGCATGAAMLAFDRGVFDGRPLENVYYGPDYSRSEIEAALRRADLPGAPRKELESANLRLPDSGGLPLAPAAALGKAPRRSRS